MKSEKAIADDRMFVMVSAAVLCTLAVVAIVIISYDLGGLDRCGDVMRLLQTTGQSDAVRILGQSGVCFVGKSLR